MLRLNVGASKKVSDNNYGSRGASINLEMELDSGLIAEPAKLQQKIRDLFGLARASLAEELGNGNGGTAATHPTATNGNGNGNASISKAQAPPSRSRPATASQSKAIYAITKARGFNLTELLRKRFNVARPEDLTVPQASQLIDEMKGQKREGD